MLPRERLTKLSLLLLTLAYLLNASLADFSRSTADLSMLVLFVTSLLLMTLMMRYITLLPMIASALGFTFEYIGLSTGFPFGSYSYLKFQGFTIHGVPIPVVIAWGVYAYTCYLAASHLVSGRLKLLVAPLLMVLLDVALDPVMVELGVWAWHSKGEWFGVPLSNYLGWFTVSFLSIGLYAVISKGRDLRVKLPYYAYLPYLSSYSMILIGSGSASVLAAFAAFSVALLLLFK